MIPIVTPEEMAAVDRAAPEPVDALIGRAGAAVARVALEMMGGAYGRRVVVVAGKGNNGADGRDAAERLRRRGVRVTVFDAGEAPGRLPRSDLVIDAAYGTGFRGTYAAPDPHGAPVLAVDIPSGVNGLTGEAGGGAVRADRTVTFAALKPGLVLLPGRTLAGTITVVDIGLDVPSARAHLVEAGDARAWLPNVEPETHKWRRAVWVVAGSPGMTGAAVLACRGAQRAGAGYVRLSTPGAAATEGAPLEVVTVPVPDGDWAAEVVEGLHRFRALVVGPGLGSGDGVTAQVRELANRSSVPTVVDGDGLTALGSDVANHVHPTTILTPHDGEFERLAGHAPGLDRIAAARDLAASTGAVVLLKGSTTVVSEPGGVVLVAAAEDARLATAGSGDVLSGVVAALCAAGVEPFRAAALGAFLHQRAATLGFARGLVAGDLPDLVPLAIASVQED